MKKQTRPLKPHTLELKQQTLLVLTQDQLKQVAGGNPSWRPSQCYTKCY